MRIPGVCVPLAFKSGLNITVYRIAFAIYAKVPGHSCKSSVNVFRNSETPRFEKSSPLKISYGFRLVQVSHFSGSSCADSSEIHYFVRPRSINLVYKYKGGAAVSLLLCRSILYRSILYRTCTAL